MIELKRVDGDVFTLNALLIEQVQAFPDTTTITLTNGKQIVVRTRSEEIIQKTTTYYKDIGLVGAIQRQVTE